MRPRIRGHTRQDWSGAVAREALLPTVGLVGVVLVTEPGGTDEWAGIAFGLLSTLALACSTLFAQCVGRAPSGLEGLAMSVCISAILLLPFSLPAAPSVNGYDWGLVVFSGIVGVSLAFTLDFQAVKTAGAKVVAMLFSLDPVMGALIGALALAESLSGPVLVGMGLIVSAGAVTTWRAESLPAPPIPTSTDRPCLGTKRVLGHTSPAVVPSAGKSNEVPWRTGAISLTCCFLAL
ncbi:permease [Streptomyces sp. 2R]|nr:permease [Streptomyces sp. 2R]